MVEALGAPHEIGQEQIALEDRRGKRSNMKAATSKKKKESLNSDKANMYDHHHLHNKVMV
jgi:hypothetical protein